VDIGGTGLPPAWSLHSIRFSTFTLQIIEAGDLQGKGFLG
jgi:hypothetical protein